MTQQNLDTTESNNEIRNSILNRLRYPTNPGSLLLADALMTCYSVSFKAQLFTSRHMAYTTVVYTYLIKPTEKISGAFTRFNENTERAATQVFSETVPSIMDASDNLYNAFSKAILDKNQSLIERYQNCSEIQVSDFNGFAEKFLQESPKCSNQNVNFARVDDLLVEIFSGWSEMYSGIAGCCSLARNRYPTPPEPTPPRIAERHLDLDSLAIQCLENVM